MASNKFVRASLYRHVHGVPSKPENEFTHIKAQATGDGTFIAANEKLFAYAGALPGRVHIWPLDKPGRIGADAPYIHVHKAGVLDYEFNTLFHDELTGGGTASLLATGSDDCAVAVTAIPNTGLKSNITDATLSLQGHERRVNVVHWHPTASNLLATGSADQTIKVWDIGAQKEALSFDGFGDGVSAFDWHCHGAHLIATCKDTKVRVYDPRSTDSVQTFQGFNGAGISRMVWKGDSTQVIGVGNIKGGSRQMGIWDTKNPSKPIMVQDLDNAGGSLFPYYDPDNTILYISGKGDGQIRYWEVTEDEPYVHFISAFTDTKSHAGVAFLPKKACDYAECEIAIALRMMGDKVTKVSFRVPRKQTGPTVFHKDLYPETSSGLKPASLSADEWLAGENRPIVKMPMNIASGAREMSSALATPTSRAASASVSGTVSPRGVSTSLSAPASTSGRSIPELERMLAQAKLKIMDLQAEVFELEQKAAKKTLDKDSAATVKAASTATASSTSAAASASASAAATATSPTASNTTSPVSSPRDSSASITTRDAAASISISTEALPGESEAQTAARIKKAKAKAAADARDYAAREKEAAKAAEKNTSAELDKAKKEAEEKIRREQQAAQAERDAEKKAKEEKEKTDKRLKEEQQAAENKVKEEKEKAEKKAKEEKEKAEKKAKEDKEAAEKKIKEEKEAAEKKSKAEKEKAEKEAATLKAEKEADLRKASAASADSDASHHMRFHGDDDDEDDDDAEAERLRAETVAKAEAIERAEAVAKKQKEIEAKAKATMEDKKKKAKDDASDMKTSASAAVSAATSAAASPTNSAPSSEPSSPTGSKKGKKGKKDKKDKKKGDCIIC